MKRSYLLYAIILACFLAILVIFFVRHHGGQANAVVVTTNTAPVVTQSSIDAYLEYEVMHSPDKSPKPIGVLPTKVGSCVITEVESTSTRLTDALTNLPIANSGSAISYTDSGSQVSYDNELGIENSNIGDKVRLCLTYIPTDCPPGDDRGKIYKATNLRTGTTWELPDAEHLCGGA